MQVIKSLTHRSCSTTFSTNLLLPVQEEWSSNQQQPPHHNLLSAVTTDFCSSVLRLLIRRCFKPVWGRKPIVIFLTKFLIFCCTSNNILKHLFWKLKKVLPLCIFKSNNAARFTQNLVYIGHFIWSNEQHVYINSGTFHYFYDIY